MLLFDWMLLLSDHKWYMWKQKNRMPSVVLSSRIGRGWTVKTVVPQATYCWKTYGDHNVVEALYTEEFCGIWLGGTCLRCWMLNLTCLNISHVTVVHAGHPNIRETEAGGLLQSWDCLGLHSECRLAWIHSETLFQNKQTSLKQARVKLSVPVMVLLGTDFLEVTRG